MRPPFARRSLPWSIASLVIAASHGCRRRGEFVEDEQRMWSLARQAAAFSYFSWQLSMKASKAAAALARVSAIQISWGERLAFRCWHFGSLLRRLAGWFPDGSAPSPLRSTITADRGIRCRWHRGCFDLQIGEITDWATRLTEDGISPQLGVHWRCFKKARTS
jgi:hypothetical protein